VSFQVIILWRRDKLKVSFDYLESGWFSRGDELQLCKQRLVHMIDARLQSTDILPFVVQLPQEFIDEHAKVCYCHYCTLHGCLTGGIRNSLYGDQNQGRRSKTCVQLCYLVSTLAVWPQTWKSWNTQGFLWTWKTQGILCNLGKIIKKQSIFSSSFRYLIRVQWWPGILLELMWNDPWWRSLLHLLFVVITYGKVSLWLWKSLENSGNFFLLLCGHRDWVCCEVILYIILGIL